MSNAYESAIVAGYSEKTAKNAVQNLVESRGIAAYLESVRGDAAKTVDKSVADVREIAQFHTAVMRNDPRGYYIENEGNGDYRIEVSGGATVEAIETIKFDKETGRPTEIKCVSKSKAAEDLGKHLGYFDKDNKQKEQTVIINVPPPTSLPKSDDVG